MGTVNHDTAHLAERGVVATTDQSAPSSRSSGAIVPDQPCVSGGRISRRGYSGFHMRW